MSSESFYSIRLVTFTILIAEIDTFSFADKPEPPSSENFDPSASESSE